MKVFMSKKTKTFKGFTLIEIIVVIAIIGILAAILIPSMLGYVKTSKVREHNSNARTVYEGAQLAMVDVIKSGNYVTPDTVFLCQAEGNGLCEDGAGILCDLTDYLGEDFSGYFGFMSNKEGSGCVYAIWSEQPLTEDMVSQQLSDADVKATFSTANPRGCHPTKL